MGRHKTHRDLFTAVLIVLMCWSVGCGVSGTSAPAPQRVDSRAASPQVIIPVRDNRASDRVSDRCAELAEWEGRWWQLRWSQAKSPDSADLLANAAEVAAIAKSLQSALQDPHSKIRKAAAACLAMAPYPTPEIQGAIAVALKSKDPDVLHGLCQLDRDVFHFPEPGPYAENLIWNFTTDEFQAHFPALVLIAGYGDAFDPYFPSLIDALSRLPARKRPEVLLRLSDVRFPEKVAQRLRQAVDRDEAQTIAAAVIALKHHPPIAARLLRDHPGIGPELSQLDQFWYPILLSDAAHDQPLRSALMATPNLGPLNAALIGSTDALPGLRRQLRSAEPHQRAVLQACIRACGGELGDVAYLSAANPIVPRPEMQLPDPNSLQQDTDSVCNLAGVEILITGELRFPDGSHPARVDFLFQDPMIKGLTTHPTPARYDATNGRFVLRTWVPALFLGNTPSKSEVFQSFVAKFRIQCPDAQPFLTEFFEELPHVVIELERRT